MGRDDFSKVPSFGYCASQGTYYYGYKRHALCGLSGVINAYDLTKVSVHDINYLIECLYRLNQKDWKPIFIPFAKETKGLFGRISALTILQYVNNINNKPIRRIKYALI